MRAIVRHALESFGYRVMEAADGAEGVDVLARHRDEIDVVLTDMMMPGMDGPSTIRALRTVRPGVPIIAASGLNSQANVARATELGVDHFLAKPASISTLLHALHDVILTPRDHTS